MLRGHHPTKRFILHRCVAGAIAFVAIYMALASSAAAQAPSWSAPILSSPYNLVNSIARMTIANPPTNGNFSGVAYSPITNGLFVIDNGSSAIYEFDRGGVYRRTINTTGFDDPEGIAWLGGNRFAVLEEKTTHINLFNIDPNTTTINKANLPLADVIRPDLTPGNPSTGSLNPTGGNTGLEGITFDAGRNQFYVAKEKYAGTPGDHAVNIYTVNLDGSASVLFNPAAPHGASTVALTSLATDVAEIQYDPITDHLLVLSQESRRIIEVTLAGEVVGTRDQPGTQAEGLVITPDHSHLFVVGESRELFDYETSPQLRTLIAPGGKWRYLDDGSNQGTAWRSASFSHSAWREGTAEFGYGDADETTVVRCGPVATCISSNQATTYFRREFFVPEADRIVELKLGLQRDDGAAVYLNGVEIYRDLSLPVNPAYNQYANTRASIVDPDEDFFVYVLVDPKLLVDGKNLLSVEVHQFSSTDLDVSFNAQLIARVPEPSSTVMLALAALCGGLVWRRRRSA